ncbi:coiled-coil domain-containing protein 122 [Anomaloglossus baeobatrachus]
MAEAASSLTEVTKQVAQQQQSEASEILKCRQADSQCQREINELETELKSVLLETKEVERKIIEEENLIENLTQKCEILETQNYSICAENIKLKLEIEIQKENFESMVSRNNGYRKRISDSIDRFSVAENKLPVMIELNKKQSKVQLLKKQKEEMILDLHNPGSVAVKQVQEEILHLSEQIKAIGECINAKKKIHEEELERHAVLRKDIEVQKKRYNAILKRLHSQINRAQLSRRQYQWNIEKMERTACSLKRSLGITQ